MNGDDFSKILNQHRREELNNVQQDFDDISSIYTAHGLNKNINATIKRVRNRDMILDSLNQSLEENEDISALNQQIRRVDD